MTRLGTISELWRYPVKSMRGERLACASFDAAGMAGDRRYAVVSTAAPTGKPLLTSRERTRMLLYAPVLDPAPVVTTPSGERLPLPSDALVATLERELGAPDARLELEHSPDRPITDVRALSFISRATLSHLAETLGSAFTPQRLRSNMIFDLDGSEPFAEESLSGVDIQLGDSADAPLLHVHERIPRCRIVTLDPETAQTDPTLLRYLAAKRQARTAVYATVKRPGSVHEGATVYRL